MKRLFNLRPADAVTVVFVSILLLLTIAFNSAIPKRLLLISIYTTLLISQFIIIRFRDRNRFLRITYDLVFPIICVIILFDSLEWVVHYVNPKDIDPLLIKLDYIIFGNHPTVMLEAIMNPFLTDILQAAYSTYYFIPVIFGITLVRNNQRKEFDRSLFLILFCFYLSYLGYIIWPALGPRFALDHLQTQRLEGFFIAEPMQNLLNRLEGIKRDAFPSGHTGVALTVLYLAYNYKRTLFRIYLPVVILLLFSTVYCRYHYVVDVIAGVILAIAAIFFGEIYYKWQEKREGVDNERF
ncbi:MAG: phosphatase PAP2 family protein [Thermodesulfovibrionales bacterium]|nr:phosphatase PAP2 family protein [Nitrospinota bacterium]MCG2710394.1 phosphatase PAP2 family protein [Thermodesulfovibrionales bacterium]MCG2813361.1 phosphatase PAP2 family protein [Thermodesulfovibrionales bacterium]